MTLYKYGNVYNLSDPFNLPGVNPRITPGGRGGMHKTGPGEYTHMDPDPIPDPFGTDLFDRVQNNPKKDNFLDFLANGFNTGGSGGGLNIPGRKNRKQTP